MSATTDRYLVNMVSGHGGVCFQGFWQCGTASPGLQNSCWRQGGDVLRTMEEQSRGSHLYQKIQPESR